MFFANDARFPFAYLCICSVIVCIMFCLRRVETESHFFAYLPVDIASMILCTARFLCIIYTEICVNATAVQPTQNVDGIDSVREEL